MTEREDTAELMVWDAPPNDLIGTVFEEIRVIPKEMFDLRKEFGLFLWGPMRGNLTACKVVDNVGEPRR